jgi:hypothetical protein
VRTLDVALTALALRALPTQPPRRERRLVPAVDDADAAVLDREALSQQRAALIASLWPKAGLCILPARYLQLAAPALFGGVFRVSWQAAARPSETGDVFPRTEGEVRVPRAA